MGDATTREDESFDRSDAAVELRGEPISGGEPVPLVSGAMCFARLDVALAGGLGVDEPPGANLVQNQPATELPLRFEGAALEELTAC